MTCQPQGYKAVARPDKPAETMPHALRVLLGYGAKTLLIAGQ